MMLTGHEKALPLMFFYYEYERRRTAPQTYLRHVIRGQQELNDLCRRNTQQAQIWQKRRFDKKENRWCKNLLMSGCSRRWFFTPGAFQITEVHQGGRFYRLSIRRAAHHENIKPHNALSKDWCIPADMHDEDFLIVDSTCEMNERGIRDKNDGNEVIDDCDLPIDLELTERVEIDDETSTYVEEDWECAGEEPEFPFTTETCQGERGRENKHNPYGEDFVKDRIVLSDVVDSIDDILLSHEIDLINDTEQDLIDDRSSPECGVRTWGGTDAWARVGNFASARMAPWSTDPKETVPTIQDVDQTSIKYNSHNNTESNWVAMEWHDP